MKTHQKSILLAVVGGAIAFIAALTPRAGADTPPANPREVNLVGKEQYTRHTLTDTDGRKLEGDIISISKSNPKTATVKFKRKSDSKEFDIPLAKLSPDDRSYLLAEDGNLREIASLDKPKQYSAEEKFLAALNQEDPQIAFAQIKYKTMAAQFLFDRETITKNTPVEPAPFKPTPLSGHKRGELPDVLATVQPKPLGQKEDVSLRAFFDKHDIRPYKEKIESGDPNWDGIYDDSLQIFHTLLQYYNAKEKLQIISIHQIHEAMLEAKKRFPDDLATFNGSRYNAAMRHVYNHFHEKTGRTLCETRPPWFTNNLMLELTKHELRNGRPVTSAVAHPHTKDGPGFNVILIGFHTAAGETSSTQGEKTTFDIIKLKSKSMYDRVGVTTEDYLPGQTGNEMSFEAVNAKQLKGITTYRFEDSGSKPRSDEKVSTSDSKSPSAEQPPLSQNSFPVTLAEAGDAIKLLSDNDPKVADYRRAVIQLAKTHKTAAAKGGFAIALPDELCKQAQFAPKPAMESDPPVNGRVAPNSNAFATLWGFKDHPSKVQGHPTLVAPYLVLEYYARHEVIPPITMDTWKSLVESFCKELKLQYNETEGYPDQAVFAAIAKHAKCKTAIHFYPVPQQKSMDTRTTQEFNCAFLSRETNDHHRPVVIISEKRDIAWVGYSYQSSFSVVGCGTVGAIERKDENLVKGSLSPEFMAKAYSIEFAGKSIQETPTEPLAVDMAITKPEFPKLWHLPLAYGAADSLGMPNREMNPEIWGALQITIPQMEKLVQLWTDLVVKPCDQDGSQYPFVLKNYNVEREKVLTTKQKEIRQRIIDAHSQLVANRRESAKQNRIKAAQQKENPGERAQAAPEASRPPIFLACLSNVQEVAGWQAVNEANHTLSLSRRVATRETRPTMPPNANPATQIRIRMSRPPVTTAGPPTPDSLALDMAIPQTPKSKPWHWPHMYGGSLVLGMPRQDKIQHLWGALWLTNRQMDKLMELWTEMVIKPCDAANADQTQFWNYQKAFRIECEKILTTEQKATRQKFQKFYDDATAELKSENLDQKTIDSILQARAFQELPSILTPYEIEGWRLVESTRYRASEQKAAR